MTTSKKIADFAKPTRRKFPTRAVLAILALWAFVALLSPCPATAELRVLRLPRTPIVLTLDENSGSVAGAFLKTPAGTKDLSAAIEGMELTSQSVTRLRLDGDSEDDIIWRISFTQPQTGGKGVHLWIALVTQMPRLWVATTPIAPTRWNSIPIKLEAPRGTTLYVSPQTPAYGNIPSYSGHNTLTFIYTIRLTQEGPSFVPVPDVYRQLLPLVHVIRDGEFDPLKRLAYTKMYDELTALSKGAKPSKEAIANFSWKKILTLEWRP